MIFLPILAASGGLVDIASDTARVFGLNWWLFISQCISFLAVAFLLQKFAYKPILTVLEERREKIAEGLENAKRTKQQLADAQKTSNEILEKANAEAQRMIEEARAAAKAVGERQTQAAIAEAEQIVARAHQATVLERDQTMLDLRKQISRLVIDTTAKVSGRVLTEEDQRRLSEDASRAIAA
ncbi:MAG: synthase subunit [Chthoniobacteraceae bacterium]|nr:synthase subunit [Chthoniobacteraceae bacterium]